MSTHRAPQEERAEDIRRLPEATLPWEDLTRSLYRLMEDEVTSPYLALYGEQDSPFSTFLKRAEDLRERGALSPAVRSLLAQASRERMLVPTFEAFHGSSSMAALFPSFVREVFFEQVLMSIMQEHRLDLAVIPPEALLEMGPVMTLLAAGLKTFWDLEVPLQQQIILSLTTFPVSTVNDTSWRILALPKEMPEEKATLLHHATLAITHKPLFRGPFLRLLLPRLQEDPLLMAPFLMALGGDDTLFMKYEGEPFPRQTPYYYFQATLLLSLLDALGPEGFLNLVKVLLQERTPLRDREVLAFLASTEEYRGMPPSWWLPLVRASLEEDSHEGS